MFLVCEQTPHEGALSYACARADSGPLGLGAQIGYTVVLIWQTRSAITLWYSSKVEESFDEADDNVSIARLMKCTWLSFWSQFGCVGVTIECPGIGSTRVLIVLPSWSFVTTWPPKAAMVLVEHVKAGRFPLLSTALFIEPCSSSALSILEVELMPACRQT